MRRNHAKIRPSRYSLEAVLTEMLPDMTVADLNTALDTYLAGIETNSQAAQIVRDELERRGAILSTEQVSAIIRGQEV